MEMMAEMHQAMVMVAKTLFVVLGLAALMIAQLVALALILAEGAAVVLMALA